jgi:hypothetical protein
MGTASFLGSLLGPSACQRETVLVGDVAGTAGIIATGDVIKLFVRQLSYLVVRVRQNALFGFLCHFPYSFSSGVAGGAAPRSTLMSLRGAPM